MNTELPRLPVGRRFAFDSERGRVWVICTRCNQWNLIPLEERWEALEDCERLVSTAEARVNGDGVGIATTSTGLSLLLATGVSRSDIANARYGHRLRRRRSRLRWLAGALALGIISVGWCAGLEAQDNAFGVYVVVLVAAWFGVWWKNPPRLWIGVRKAGVRPSIVWGWHLKEVRFEPAVAAPPGLLVPGSTGLHRMSGDDAARFLAVFLPKVSGVDDITASISAAVSSVDSAERAEAPSRSQGGRGSRARDLESGSSRPSHGAWQRLARRTRGAPLLSLPPEDRLALEMAVTEVVEQLALADDAAKSRRAWADEEEIGAIADDLLVSDAIRSKVDALSARARRRRKPS